MLEASGAPEFTLQQGGWITVYTQEAVLSQRAAKCGLHNSEPGINTLQARENGEARASVCLTMKGVLLLDFSRNISSVDKVPSQ